MTFKEFKLEIPGKGLIIVNFFLHFDEEESWVDNINIISDFDTDIPRNPHLVYYDNEWQLCDQSDQFINIGQKYYNDDIGKLIVQKIKEIKAEEQAPF